MGASFGVDHAESQAAQVFDTRLVGDRTEADVASSHVVREGVEVFSEGMANLVGGESEILRLVDMVTS